MANIGESNNGLTKEVKKLRPKKSGGQSKDCRGVSCINCGEVMDSLFPGQSFTAIQDCPNGCNNSSGGGIAKKMVQKIQQELNQKRSWKERASLKER